MTAASIAGAAPSYAGGVSDVPLLGDTIGANFERTVDRFGDREALVDHPSGRRWTMPSWMPPSTMSPGGLACPAQTGDGVETSPGAGAGAGTGSPGAATTVTSACVRTPNQPSLGWWRATRSR